jgi:hypothetical protein
LVIKNEIEMKKIALYTILVFFFACTPGYRVYLVNYSNNDIALITSPAIDSHFNKTLFKNYDTLNLNTFSENKATYNVKKGIRTVIYAHAWLPSKKHFPFNSFEIIKKHDTIKIDSQNVMNYLVKKSRNNYYIEIK